MSHEEIPGNPRKVERDARGGGWSIFTKVCLAVSIFTVAFCVGCVGCIFALKSYLPRNRARVIDNIRLVTQAEEQYAEAYGGYTWVGCPALPEECWPSYPKDGPRFLSELPTWHFWDMEFYPGPPAETGADHTFQSYALMANGRLDGMSSFCADSTGTFCVVKVDLGVAVQIEDGQCVVTDPAQDEVEQSELNFLCVPMD